jgi:hypothetical protein
MMNIKEYEALVDDIFRTVVAEYHFKKTQAVAQGFECWVIYQNSTTEISIFCEAGSLPWVRIADVHNPQNVSSLEWLMVELGIEKMPTPEEAYHFPKYTGQDIIAALQKKAQQLHEYGQDVLTGKFAIFPKLQERGLRFVRECEAYQESKNDN